jgi:hypothetical protein
MTMSRRRFMILAVALVAVNSFFWLASGGFALSRALIDQYFGQRMIRAEVLVQTPSGGTEDYRIDRGLIRAIAPGTITLKEKNGDMVPIQLATDASVTGPGGRSRGTGVLRLGLRVTVLRLANAPAQSVQIEGIGP